MSSNAAEVGMDGDAPEVWGGAGAELQVTVPEGIRGESLRDEGEAVAPAAAPDRLSPSEVEALEPIADPTPPSDDPPVDRAENPGGPDTDQDRQRVRQRQVEAAAAAVAKAEGNVAAWRDTVRIDEAELDQSRMRLAAAQDALVAARWTHRTVRSTPPGSVVLSAFAEVPVVLDFATQAADATEIVVRRALTEARARELKVSGEPIAVDLRFTDQTVGPADAPRRLVAGVVTWK